MSLFVRALRRPRPAPVAGTFASVAAHAAALIVAVGGSGPSAPAPDSASEAAPTRAAAHGGGERLLWVGLGDGGTKEWRPAFPGDRPPSAYVVPGRDGRPGRPGGVRGVRADAPAVPADGALPDATPAPPRAPLPPAPVALPDVALPDDATAAVLVAGVLSASPDLTRRVTRPEDFAAMRPADFLGALAEFVPQVGLTAARAEGPVDVLPVPLVDNPPPAYPASLARARMDGRVVVEFRIDSAGAVDLATLRVVQSTHALFTQAVRGVLPRLRFVPAQLRARAVGLTVRQPFVFRVLAAR
jgi:TonB family protein